MKLQEVFDQLTSGEFSQLSIGGLEQGGMCDEDKKRIINLIHTGLTQIYKRFKLKEGTLELILQPEVLTYKLHSNFLISNTDSVQTVRYLKDVPLIPFQDNLLKIERVFDNYGVELPINMIGNAYSVTTPIESVVVVPPAILTLDYHTPAIQSLKILYRANHFKIDINEGAYAAMEYELDLPESYLVALLYNVASRIHNPIGMTNEFHAGNSYAAKYEEECRRLETENMEIDYLPERSRFELNGWV